MRFFLSAMPFWVLLSWCFCVVVCLAFPLWNIASNTFFFVVAYRNSSILGEEIITSYSLGSANLRFLFHDRIGSAAQLDLIQLCVFPLMLQKCIPLQWKEILEKTSEFFV